MKKALSGKPFKLKVIDLNDLGASLEGILNRLETQQETPELWKLVNQIPNIDGWISLHGQPVATQTDQRNLPLVFVNTTGQPSKWQPNTRLEFRILPLVPSPKITDINSSDEELFALRYEVVRKP